MEVFWFMLCSTLETLAIYSLIMTLFRFKTSEYIWQALVVMLLANVQSYILRNELALDYLAPIISMFMFMALFATIVKLPVIWSAISTILGFVLYALIQTVFVVMIFGSIEAAQTSGLDAYILQVVTAGTALLLSWLLYRFGIGFAFDFERFRFKFENIFLLIIIVLALIVVTVLFYFNQAWVNIFFFALTFIYFIYYSIKTEERDINDH